MAGFDLVTLLIAAFAGLSCGFLNVVASSGSAVSLPILMWLGLHAIDANATNRIPVLIASATATLTMARHGKIPRHRPACGRSGDHRGSVRRRRGRRHSQP